MTTLKRLAHTAVLLRIWTAPVQPPVLLEAQLFLGTFRSARATSACRDRPSFAPCRRPSGRFVPGPIALCC